MVDVDELTGADEDRGSGALHVDKEIYDFVTTLRNVRPIEIPQQAIETSKQARQGSEDRKKKAISDHDYKKMKPNKDIQ